MSIEAWSYVIYAVGVLIAAISQVLLKKAADKKQDAGFFAKFLNVRVILAYGLLFVSLFVNTIALRHMQLKYVPCMTAAGFIYILILSRIFLKEKLTWKKLLGNALIVGGILLFIL